jgi:hypothetical protein
LQESESVSNEDGSVPSSTDGGGNRIPSVSGDADRGEVDDGGVDGIIREVHTL